MEAVFAGGLSKTYASGAKALDNVTFSLEQGEIFGFLGPNGAGKTTAVKLFNGMLAPSSGECSVFGLNPAESPEKIHALSGVVTEHAQMYDNLTGFENLVFFGKLFGLGSGESKSRACASLERLSLIDAKDQKLFTYSTGMRQRLSLARALLHEPRILFLDEPTSGLDPECAQSVNMLIKGLANDRGTTVFLCTHQLRYAQQICTCYGLIDRGRLLAAGDIGALRSMLGSGISVGVKARGVPESMAAEAKQEDGEYVFPIRTEAEIPPLVRRIVEGGGDIYHVSARVPSLEQIYFSLIEAKEDVF